MLGPTGAGKTPLGLELERRGLDGRRCRHFDFGEALRRVAAARTRPAGLTAAQCATVKHSLATGALLEKKDFPIAAALLRAFAARHTIGGKDVVVLNGLPRHVGQARDVDRIARVRAVVHLVCTAAVVRERIRTDAGGDRTGRVDDTVADVERKLRTFRARTFPLLDHYRAKKVRIVRLNVTRGMRGADAALVLEQRCVLGRDRAASARDRRAAPGS